MDYIYSFCFFASLIGFVVGIVIGLGDTSSPDNLFYKDPIEGCWNLLQCMAFGLTWYIVTPIVIVFKRYNVTSK